MEHNRFTIGHKPLVLNLGGHDLNMYDLFFARHLILGDICVFVFVIFAVYLMRNCIYVCLMTRNIGSGYNLVMSDCKVGNWVYKVKNH